MATAYKTPGVYVEEIPKFPPSIAAVETAIPAFIGYTEKAIRNGESLIKKPTRIESIAEYELLFGGSPSQNVEVFLNNENNFVKAQAESALYLYDSLRMFYANGGGKCYIISVGKYPTSNASISAIDIKEGLLELEKEDEPTIIIMPDAVSIDTNGPYSLQQDALGQCNKLMDRVALCDMVKTTDITNFNTKAGEFRTAIGINFLKYGAAYGPWINANLPRQIWRKNLRLKRDGTGTDIQLESLTTDSDIANLIRDIKLAETAYKSLKDSAFAISGAADKTLNDALQQALDKYRLTTAASTSAELTTALQMFTKLTFDILKAVQEIKKPTQLYPSDTKFQITDAIKSYLSCNPGLKKIVLELGVHHKLQGANAAAKTAADTAKTAADTAKTAADAAKTAAEVAAAAAPNDAALAAALAAAANTAKMAAAAAATAADYATAIAIAVAAPINNIILTGLSLDTTAVLLDFTTGTTLLADTTANAVVAAQYPGTVDTIKKRADIARDAAYSAAQNAITMFNSIQTSTYEFEKNLNDTLLAAFGKFKELVTKGAEALNLLPPSGAVAGVYAAVDRDRGVWKAPANVSLNAVISPAVKISQDQQGEYNVDVNAGKSINIIRSFTGKGTLVWGARTLAGNDNEWRYVSVRRFFNFVEESVKKATEQFVFEPNDANTWVRIQGMIENFLTVLWRQGALQGIKPEHAFYVAVGLGKTMTPIDILEGRLIVEIGMAAVRPAEFIILKFSHKMAES